MDEDAAWYGSRPRLRPHCTRRDPSFRKRDTAAPYFRPMSIVDLWPRSPISATAELLYAYLASDREGFQIIDLSVKLSEKKLIEYQKVSLNVYPI